MSAVSCFRARARDTAPRRSALLPHGGLIFSPSFLFLFLFSSLCFVLSDASRVARLVVVVSAALRVVVGGAGAGIRLTGSGSGSGSGLPRSASKAEMVDEEEEEAEPRDGVFDAPAPLLPPTASPFPSASPLLLLLLSFDVPGADARTTNNGEGDDTDEGDDDQEVARRERRPPRTHPPSTRAERRGRCPTRSRGKTTTTTSSLLVVVGLLQLFAAGLRVDVEEGRREPLGLHPGARTSAWVAKTVALMIR